MKFGKTLLSQQLPEYSAYYINYKALKKIIKSLAAGSENETLLDDNGNQQTRIQANKATFFFKLERELDKVNAFYLQKEVELRARFTALLEKKRTILARSSKQSRTSAKFIVLQEGFQQFERDLNKLQQYVELNATGFYKALKKWDKRSKSHTRELYLSRRVEIQPVFDRDVLSELVDTATSVLLDLEAYANGEEPEGDTPSSKIDNEAMNFRAEDDIDSDILKAMLTGTPEAVKEILSHLGTSDHVDLRLTTIFMQAMSEASDEALETIVNTNLISFEHPDEISGRLCIHEAVLAGRPSLVRLCLLHTSDLTRADVYGRTVTHYACMQSGSIEIISNLLQHNAPVNVLDHNISSPLHYAIIHGKIEFVRLLLQYGAEVNPRVESDYIPLSMACAQGHIEIAELLLEHGAKVLPNAEGLLPIHLVARAGHAGICRLLVKHKVDVEARDKFSGWTPMFFAASEGHVAVIQELLECGSLVDTRDEDRHSPAYYAAWEGHKNALKTLLAAGGAFGTTESTLRKPLINDAACPQAVDDDGIPSLLLPPPILPVRSYGHNYLDKMIFTQITLTGSSRAKAQSPVVWYMDGSLFSSSKLTISLKSTKRKAISELIPHTVSLPIANESQSFSFQCQSLGDLCLEFEIYPTFGSKVIAKGVASPDLFAKSSAGRSVVVPLLDPRLQLIGHVSFDYTVIHPFAGAQFDIHSRIETYWKSTQTITIGQKPQYLVTESSLSGEFLWVPIQITNDLVPVVCPTWFLPIAGVELGAADVRSTEFMSICGNMPGRQEQIQKLATTQNDEALKTMNQMYIQLSEFLAMVPDNVKLHLHIIRPTVQEQVMLSTSITTSVNDTVDQILNCVFKHADEHKPGRNALKSLFFSSSNADICTALNWKQPNCEHPKSICEC